MRHPSWPTCERRALGLVIGIATLGLGGCAGANEESKPAADEGTPTVEQEARAAAWEAKRSRVSALAAELLAKGAVTGAAERAQATAEALAEDALAAELIVVARPIAERVEIESLGGDPFPRTYVTLAIERTLVGEAPRELTLSFWGGAYQGRHIAASTTLSLQMGKSKLFLLSAERARGRVSIGLGSGYPVDDHGVDAGALRLGFDRLTSAVDAERRAAR